MPETSQMRKLRSDPSVSQTETESTSFPNEENLRASFSEQDSEVSSKISKRIRDTEFGQTKGNTEINRESLT